MSQIIGLWDCDGQTYHKDTAYVSNSMLKTFRESVILFHDTYIAKTIEPETPTPALALGTAVHALILQPEKSDELIAVYPAGDGRNTKVKEARANFALDLGDRTAITTEQWDMARRMADTAYAHPTAKELLEEPGMVEQSVRVECPETGKRKARFDKLFPTGHILDVKTSIAPQPERFSRQAYNLGYHRQAAYYEDVRDIAMGDGTGLFLLLVVGSSVPHEVIIYEIDMNAKALGRAENYALLKELRKREEENNWTSRWADVQTLELPAWAMRTFTRQETE